MKVVEFFDSFVQGLDVSPNFPVPNFETPNPAVLANTDFVSLVNAGEADLFSFVNIIGMIYPAW